MSDDIEITDFCTEDKGTIIFMELSNMSKRTAREVFDMFANADDGFIKTRIPLKNIYDIYPVARSQAKRLCEGFEKFQEVELDFDGIEELGQGFAHELFVIYANEHPNVKLVPINACEEVQRMINHVLKH